MLTENEYAKLDRILGKAHAAPESLTQIEQDFVDAMTHRLNRHGRGLAVSDHRWKVLGDILAKVA